MPPFFSRPKKTVGLLKKRPAAVRPANRSLSRYSEIADGDRLEPTPPLTKVAKEGNLSENDVFHRASVHRSSGTVSTHAKDDLQTIPYDTGVSDFLDRKSFAHEFIVQGAECEGLPRLAEALAERSVTLRVGPGYTFCEEDDDGAKVARAPRVEAQSRACSRQSRACSRLSDHNSWLDVPLESVETGHTEKKATNRRAIEFDKGGACFWIMRGEVQLFRSGTSDVVANVTQGQPLCGFSSGLFGGLEGYTSVASTGAEVFCVEARELLQLGAPWLDRIRVAWRRLDAQHARCLELKRRSGSIDDDSEEVLDADMSMSDDPWRITKSHWLRRKVLGSETSRRIAFFAKAHAVKSPKYAPSECQKQYGIKKVPFQKGCSETNSRGAALLSHCKGRSKSYASSHKFDARMEDLDRKQLAILQELAVPKVKLHPQPDGPVVLPLDPGRKMQQTVGRLPRMVGTPTFEQRACGRAPADYFRMTTLGSLEHWMHHSDEHRQQKTEMPVRSCRGVQSLRPLAPKAVISDEADVKDQTPSKLDWNHWVSGPPGSRKVWLPPPDDVPGIPMAIRTCVVPHRVVLDLLYWRLQPRPERASGAGILDSGALGLAGKILLFIYTNLYPPLPQESEALISQMEVRRPLTAPPPVSPNDSPAVRKRFFTSPSGRESTPVQAIQDQNSRDGIPQPGNCASQSDSSEASSALVEAAGEKPSDVSTNKCISRTEEQRPLTTSPQSNHSSTHRKQSSSPPKVEESAIQRIQDERVDRDGAKGGNLGGTTDIEYFPAVAAGPMQIAKAQSPLGRMELAEDTSLLRLQDVVPAP